MEETELTLRQLIAELQKMMAYRPELADETVEIEGCDCTDTAGAVEFLEKYSARVVISRSSGGVLHD